MSVWRRKLRKAAFMPYFWLRSLLIRVPRERGSSHSAQSDYRLKCPHPQAPKQSQSANQGDSTGRGLLLVVWGRKNRRPVPWVKAKINTKTVARGGGGMGKGAWIDNQESGWTWKEWKWFWNKVGWSWVAAGWHWCRRSLPLLVGRSGGLV